MSTKAATLFYCYAHEDEGFRQELEKHLAWFKRQGHLVSWSDREIAAGTQRKQEIIKRLRAANVIVLLISPDFMQSDACDEEMRLALALGKEGRAEVVPILVRSVVWQDQWLADVQVLPATGKPIKLWEDRDKAWQQVAERLGQIIYRLLDLPPLLPGMLPKPTSQIPVASHTSKPTFEPRKPYKGLFSFEEKDAGDFFGRERLVGELLEKVRATLSAEGTEVPPRLLTVFGPSGLGKSSVVKAGLLPALRSGELEKSASWVYLDMKPGTRPLEMLARTLSGRFPERSLVSLQEDSTCEIASRKSIIQAADF